jgi:hypothetical protein
MKESLPLLKFLLFFYCIESFLPYSLVSLDNLNLCLSSFISYMMMLLLYTFAIGIDLYLMQNE